MINISEMKLLEKAIEKTKELLDTALEKNEKKDMLNWGSLYANLLAAKNSVKEIKNISSSATAKPLPLVKTKVLEKIERNIELKRGAIAARQENERKASVNMLDLERPVIRNIKTGQVMKPDTATAHYEGSSDL